MFHKDTITDATEPKVARATVSRDTILAEQVVFLDGLSGTGKTMMGPILASLDRVEAPRFEHDFEYVCALHFLGRIEEDAAATLSKMRVDLACYNSMIARESNFRWSDLSGVLGSPGGWRYLLRLFQRDGDAVMERIRSERPIVHIHSHYALGTMAPLFRALGDRMRVVEMVRHPLYLLEHAASHVMRHGSDPREFTICISHKGHSFPWFAVGWEEAYLGSNQMDRIIYFIDWLTRLVARTIEEAGDEVRKRVIFVPFERFVVDPWPYLEAIEQALGTRRTGLTRRTLRKQKVPRRLLRAGPDRDIYRRYNWKPPLPGSSESDEVQRLWAFARGEASDRALEVLQRLSSDYEEAYLAGQSPG
jgi:hypothetical protein